MLYSEARRVDKNRYQEALTQQILQRIRCVVRVLDQEERSLTQLQDQLVGGQVDVSVGGDVTRSCTLQFIDPKGKLIFDPDNGVYAKHFINVRRGLWVDAIGDWMDVDVFYGPITGFERNGEVVSVEAQGKEALLLPPRPFKFPDEADVAGRDLGGYIRRLASSMGERKFDLAAGGVKISKNEASDAAKNEDEGLWGYLRGLADANNFQLFYATDGRLTLRNYPDTPDWTFNARNLLSEATVTVELAQEFRNQVVVKVNPPESTGFTVTRTLAPSHPLSPQKLAWNGVPRVLRETKLVDKKITQARAEEIADRMLRRSSRAVISANFETLPVPHLIEEDVVRIRTDYQSEAFTLREFTIPLTSEESMSVGYTKALRLKRYRAGTRIRKHPKKKKKSA